MSNIHQINLASIDLNLLTVFDALMIERSVTKAGERLGLSQPATSNALARLRHLLHDELFIRTSSGLQPTPKAIALAQKFQPALQQIQSALAGSPSFDPLVSERVFSLGMTDYTEFVILPKLIQKIQTIAPHLKLQIRTGDREKLLGLLDKGEIDLACAFFPEQIPWHEEELLFREKYVCVCRANHPHIGNVISLADYINASHLLVSIKEDMVGRVDHLLAAQDLKRHITIAIPHFLVAPFILAQTDLIASLAEHVAKTFAKVQNLKLLALPFALEGFPVFMRWHRSNHERSDLTWLRTTIAELFAEGTI